MFIWEFLLIGKLFSILRSMYAYLLLIHPLFLLCTAWNFEIPFSEIGVGYTFTDKFELLIQSDSGSDYVSSFFLGNIFQNYSSLYLSSIPVIAIKLLFTNLTQSGLYIWSNIFHLLAITLGAMHLFWYRSLSKSTALAIILFFIIAPSFLEIHSTLHRYSLLFTGLLICFNSINFIHGKFPMHNIVAFITLLILSILLILVTKPAMIFSIVTYIGLITLGKFNGKISLLVFLIAFILIIDIFGLGFLSNFESLSRYQQLNRDGGNSFAFLAKLFGIGFFFRLLYAALSPFPWVNFSQWDLYGGNSIFLFIHVFTAISSLYLLAAFFINLKKIRINDFQNNPIIFGFALLLSLRFSSIGFHVYLVPALPFLAPIVLNKSYKFPLIFIVLFILILEFFLFVFKLF